MKLQKQLHSEESQREKELVSLQIVTVQMGLEQGIWGHSPSLSPLLTYIWKCCLPGLYPSTPPTPSHRQISFWRNKLDQRSDLQRCTVGILSKIGAPSHRDGSHCLRNITRTHSNQLFPWKYQSWIMRHFISSLRQKRDINNWKQNNNNKKLSSEKKKKGYRIKWMEET